MNSDGKAFLIRVSKAMASPEYKALREKCIAALLAAMLKGTGELRRRGGKSKIIAETALANDGKWVASFGVMGKLSELISLRDIRVEAEKRYRWHTHTDAERTACDGSPQCRCAACDQIRKKG